MTCGVYTSRCVLHVALIAAAAFVLVVSGAGADAPRVFVSIRAVARRVPAGRPPSFHIVVANETSTTLWLPKRPALHLRFSARDNRSVVVVERDNHWVPPHDDFQQVPPASRVAFMGTAFELTSLPPGDYLVKATYHHSRLGDEPYASQSNHVNLHVQRLRKAKR